MNGKPEFVTYSKITGYIKPFHLIYVLVIALFIISFIGFVLTPFTGDLQVLMGGAKQADFFDGGLIYNSFMQWDLKGALYRLTNYTIFLIANHIAGFANYCFSSLCLFIYAIFICAVSYISIKLVVGKGKSIKEIILFSMLLSITFFTAQVICRMQAEMTSILLLLLSFALYINAMLTSRYSSLKIFISGMLIGSVFFFKSPLILLSISFIAAAYLWEKKNGFASEIQRYVLLAVGSVTTLLMIFVVILLINPHEIQNMFAASVYQQTLLSTKVSIARIFVRFTYGYMQGSLGIPVLTMGLLCMAVNLINNIKMKRFADAMVQVVLWLTPTVYVAISNCYFTYHFLVFVLPSLFEIYMIYCCVKEYNITVVLNRRLIYMGLVLVTFSVLTSSWLEKIIYWNYMDYLMGFIVFLLVSINAASFLKNGKVNINQMVVMPLLFLSFIYMSYVSIFSINTNSYIKLTNAVYAQKITLPIPDSEEVLFLDDGVGSYLLGNKSYLAEYYPLPLQRIAEGSENSKRTFYRKAFERATNYEGEYISVYENWFFGSGKNETMLKKLNNEYKKVGSYITYSIPMCLFEKQDESNLRYNDIYKRIASDRLNGSGKMRSPTNWVPKFSFRHSAIRWFKDKENLRQCKPNVYNIESNG